MAGDTDLQSEAGYTLTEAPPGPNPKVENQLRWHQESFRTEALGLSPRRDSPGRTDFLQVETPQLPLQEEESEHSPPHTPVWKEFNFPESTLSPDSQHQTNEVESMKLFDTTGLGSAMLVPSEQDAADSETPQAHNAMAWGSTKALECRERPHDSLDPEQQGEPVVDQQTAACGNNTAGTKGARGEIRSLSQLRKMSVVAESKREFEYNPRSLFLFSLNNPIRKGCIRAIQWKWWDRIVLFLIALNTVQLAMYDPFDIPELRPVSERREALDLVGQAFSLIFAAECVVKVVALGLCVGENTFLTSAWNYLDLFIVIIGLLDFIPSGGGSTGNLSALRSLRVLRPLRAITKFPELRFLVVLLLKSIPMLSNVLGLCCFLFFVFGILGVQLFAGRFRGRCFDVDSGEVGDMCALDGGYALCEEGAACLLLGENPDRQVIHFDHIGGAIMTIFQIMTMEGWTGIMYTVQDTFHPSMFTYFVLLIFVGPIFAIQLFLVVISTQYALTKKKQDKREKQDRELAEEETQQEGRLSLEAAARDAERLASAAPPRRGGLSPFGGVGLGSNRVHPEPRPQAAPPPLPAPGSETQPPAEGETAGQGGAADGNQGQQEEGPGEEGRTPVGQQGVQSGGAGRRESEKHILQPPPEVEETPGGSELEGLRERAESAYAGGGKKTKKFSWRWWRRRAKEVAESEGLSNFIVAMIVLNTLLMGVDHDCDLCNQGYCARFKAVMEGTNLAFAGIFLGEMLIKVVGLGPLAYLQSPMNLFDAAIVAVSLLEVQVVYNTSNCLWNTPVPYLPPPCDHFDACEGGGGGLTVLRTFRLVRIIKLLRTFPDIQKQVKIVVSIVGSVAALIALIFIFLLIFCILGMNVFGGQVVEEWDPELIMLGADVYVDFPGDSLPAGLRGRHGEVVDLDPFNHSSRPWQVAIRYGEEAQVHEALGLGPDGRVWVTDVDNRVSGEPGIVAVVPRLNYDDLLYSAITTFQILTTANWNDVLYSHIASTTAGASLFFYAIIVVGNWMLLNLFIAILIQGFADQRAEKLEKNQQKIEEGLIHELGGLSEAERAVKLEALWSKMDADGSGEVSKAELRKMLEEMGVVLGAKEMTDMFRKYDEDDSGVLNFHEFLQMIHDILLHAQKKALQKKLRHSSRALLAGAEEASGSSGGKEAGARVAELRRELRGSQQQLLAGMGKSFKQAEELHQLRRAASAPTEPWSLLLFAPDNRFRLACKAVAEHWAFDKLVLACILISSVCLAIESPNIGDSSPLRLALNAIDLVLNGVFTLECLLKVIALSFRKYIKSGWNKLDLVIVSTSLLDMVITYGVQGDIDLAMLKIFRTFRILRALRPLRIIARARGLRVLVSTLVSAIKPVLNTGAIALGVFAIFGILGMQLLSGKMYACTDPMMHNWKDCKGIDDDGNVRQWESYPVHFNNIAWAIRSMFVLSTQDGWPEHMFAGIDATSKKTGPVQGSQPGLVIYYVASILIAGYLVINIFVGVFVDCYNSASSELEKAKDPKIKRKDLPQVFDDPKSHRRRQCAQMITTSFDLFIAFFIVTNVLTMAFESFLQAQWQTDFGLVANFFFSYVFGVECLFKIFAYHPRRYLVSGWHKFDYFIVMVSYAGICIDSMGSSVQLDPTLLRVLRVFRIFRILRAFRIFKAAKGLQAIIATLGNSLASLVNLGSMLALVFFIFAVLGVTLFGELCAGGDEELEGLRGVRCLFTAEDAMLEFHANFKGIGIALLLLFRVATGDAWGELLEAAQLEPGGRGLSEAEWAKFVELRGAAPEGWGREDKEAPLEVAAAAVERWYAAVQGGEGGSEAAQGWVDMARIALPGCVLEEEIVELEARGLADCSVGGHSKACVSSCGSAIAANLYFSIFFCLSAFVLLQLVIAVLMEQLSAMDSDARDTQTVANTALPLPRFKQLVRRWRWNFRRKTLPRARWAAWRARRTSSAVALLGSLFSRTPSSAPSAAPTSSQPPAAPSPAGEPQERAPAEEAPMQEAPKEVRVVRSSDASADAEPPPPPEGLQRPTTSGLGDERLASRRDSA